jgi:hypothetical protein
MYALDDPPLRIAECGHFYSAGMSGFGHFSEVTGEPDDVCSSG